MRFPALSDLPLARHVHERLGVEIHVELGQVGRVPPARGEGGSDRCDAFCHAARKASWINGRRLLQRLLPWLGLDTDPRGLRFPHRALSLSHSRDWSVAIGAEGHAGLGVDLEFHRDARPGVTRLFLGDAEEAWLASVPPIEKPGELIRLWTVKEAVFKACVPNGHLTLLDIEIPQPAVHVGCASLREGPARCFRYCSMEVLEGWVSVSIERSDDENR